MTTPAIVQGEPRYVQQHLGPLTIAGHVIIAERETQPVWHLDGVSWFDADPPPQWHGHWAQSVGRADPTANMQVCRCPCGAYSEDGRVWVHLGRPRVVPWWRHLRRQLRRRP